MMTTDDPQAGGSDVATLRPVATFAVRWIFDAARRASGTLPVPGEAVRALRREPIRAEKIARP